MIALFFLIFLVLPFLVQLIRDLRVLAYSQSIAILVSPLSLSLLSIPSLVSHYFSSTLRVLIFSVTIQFFQRHLGLLLTLSYHLVPLEGGKLQY